MQSTVSPVIRTKGSSVPLSVGTSFESYGCFKGAGKVERNKKADGKKIDQYIKEVELWKKARSSDASSWFVQPLHTGERVSTSSFTATQTAAEDVSVVPASRPSVIALGDHALAAFIQELEVKSNELFTEDVLQQLVFVKEIKELARTYASFRSARDEYRSNISSGVSHARSTPM